MQGIGTHAGDKLVGVLVRQHLILPGEFVDDVQVLVFGEEVENLYAFFSQGTGLNYDVPLVIDNLVELFCGQAQQVADFVGERLEVPDVGNGHHQFDVTHALTTHLLLGYFHAATVADDALVADALVLAAVAFPVLHRTENPLAEQATHLGLVRAVVDGFRFHHFAGTALQNCFGRGQRNSDFGEVLNYFLVFCESHLISFKLIAVGFELFDASFFARRMQEYQTV